VIGHGLGVLGMIAGRSLALGVSTLWKAAGQVQPQMGNKRVESLHKPQGFHHVNGNEPFEALDTCDLLNDATERCWGGRFYGKCYYRLQGPGAMLHTTEVTRTADEKRMLFDRTGALAVDMESAAVAQVARGAQIPFAIVRAIVDPQTTPIPAAALASIDELGRPRIASLLSALAREPRDLLALVRLSACFRAALASLKRAAEIAGLSISRGE